MNSFGRLFRLSIFGESHGVGVGILVDGCPAGLPLDVEDFRPDLERRMPTAPGTTPRAERDQPEIMSGVHQGRTTGAPIQIFFKNADIRSEDYEIFKDMPRPGHADFVSRIKFGGYNDHRGSGHFSGRVTLGLAAAGAIAKKIIRPVMVQACLEEAGGDAQIERAVAQAAKDGDSIGGLIQCRIESAPPGLGEPFFDSVESLLAHMIFSIPAVKGIEFGAGFKSARMRGKEHNDLIVSADGKTETNHSGGVNGGLTNGNPIVFRVAVKPTSSIPMVQNTFNFKSGRREPLAIRGRHDVCIALRLPVIIEAAAALILADLMLIEQKIPKVL